MLNAASGAKAEGDMTMLKAEKQKAEAAEAEAKAEEEEAAKVHKEAEAAAAEAAEAAETAQAKAASAKAACLATEARLAAEVEAKAEAQVAADAAAVAAAAAADAKRAATAAKLAAVAKLSDAKEAVQTACSKFRLSSLREELRKMELDVYRSGMLALVEFKKCFEEHGVNTHQQRLFLGHDQIAELHDCYLPRSLLRGDLEELAKAFVSLAEKAKAPYMAWTMGVGEAEAGQRKAMKESPELTTAVKAIEQDKGCKLSQLMATPFQQVFRYLTIFDNILKVVEVQGSPAEPSVRAALAQCKSLATFINAKIRPNQLRDMLLSFNLPSSKRPGVMADLESSLCVTECKFQTVKAADENVAARWLGGSLPTYSRWFSGLVPAWAANSTTLLLLKDRLVFVVPGTDALSAPGSVHELRREPDKELLSAPAPDTPLQFIFPGLQVRRVARTPPTTLPATMPATCTLPATLLAALACRRDRF